MSAGLTILANALLVYGVIALIVLWGGIIIFATVSRGDEDDRPTRRVAARTIILCWAWPVLTIPTLRSLWAAAEFGPKDTTTNTHLIAHKYRQIAPRHPVSPMVCPECEVEHPASNQNGGDQ